jgi:nickel-type superoxide dismutase maturation protease
LGHQRPGHHLVHRELNNVSLAELLAWICRRRIRVRVCGDSMSPTLREGEVVLMDPHTPPKVGDVVVCRHPFQPSLVVIKRITELQSDGGMFLRGDNPDESTDSRSYGLVPVQHYRGRVNCRWC